MQPLIVVAPPFWSLIVASRCLQAIQHGDISSHFFLLNRQVKQPEFGLQLVFEALIIDGSKDEFDKPTRDRGSGIVLALSSVNGSEAEVWRLLKSR
jgi:hypothetical protein